jgi:hypothetical protein
VSSRALARIACSVACVFGAAHAGAQSSPCDDPSYAREFKVYYPNEINRVYTDEQQQRQAWNARADAIGAQLAASGAMSKEAHAAFRLELSRRRDVAELDGRIAQAAEEFRERNIALQGAPAVALLDPARPNRAWCMLATSALDALKNKVAIEGLQWQLVDQALLAGAASKGVHFAN